MERQEILVSKLLADLQNPRLPEVQPSQRDAIRAIAKAQGGPKLIALAEHIVKFGVNLADLPIVMPVAPDEDRFTVLDGNRRLSAIRALEAPDLVAGRLTPADTRRLKKLSSEYQKQPVESLLCAIVSSRAEADPWIQIRHRGESGGAGLVRWDGAQGARYDSRSGQAAPHLDALAFVKRHADLPAGVEARLANFPVSTLARLVNDPDVRVKLGLDLRSGTLYTRYPDGEAVKGLGRVVADLATGKKTVTDLKRKEDRIRYVGGFSAADLPNPEHVGPLRLLLNPNEDVGEPKKAPARKPRKADAARATLIPKDFSPSIPQQRIESVLLELKALHPDTFKNVAAVMLRVFTEWCIEDYIDRNGLRTTLTEKQRRSLHKRLIVVMDHLERGGKLKPEELKSVRVEANNPHSLIAMDTLHAYVHDRVFIPKPSELLQTWDRLQPVVEGIWS